MNSTASHQPRRSLPHRVFRSLWRSIKGVFSLSREDHVVFGILPVAGPKAGWLISDYAAWAFLLSNMPTFNRQLSRFHTIRPIAHLFPENRVIFGEAGCPRSCLPLSPSLFICDDQEASPEDFASDWLFELRTFAPDIKPEQTLVVLLTGHGFLGAKKKFHLIVTVEGEEEAAVIKASDLGRALKSCPGKIIILSNSCMSGALESELSKALHGKQWSLICAAGPQEYSDALSQSASGFVRGSGFTFCALAQVGVEYSVNFPWPRSQRRAVQPSTSPDRLPDSPPPNSLTSHAISLTEPLEGMKDIEKFLIWPAGSTYRIYGSHKTHSEDPLWKVILPLRLTDALTLHPDFLSAEAFNSVFYPITSLEQGRSSAMTLVERDSAPFLLLAKAFIEVPHLPLSTDYWDAQLCVELIADPYHPSRSRLWEREFAIILRSRHIQTIALQDMARRVGWWTEGEDGNNMKVLCFLPRNYGDWRVDREKMIGYGMRIDLILAHLQARHFPNLSLGMDTSATFWFAEKWVTADRPKVSPEQWRTSIREAADFTVKNALVP